MTLKEMLEYLSELSEKGMSGTDTFAAAVKEYTHTVKESTNADQIRKAIKYLETVDGIETLDTANLTDQLQRRLEKLN